MGIRKFCIDVYHAMAKSENQIKYSAIDPMYSVFTRAIMDTLESLGYEMEVVIEDVPTLVITWQVLECLLWGDYMEIIDFLEKAYVGARAYDDVEMMIRISRAIIAFSCDNLEECPTWEEMVEEYISK